MTTPLSTSKHQAKKRFGQNFLIDANTINRIIRAINPLPGQHLIEIGPGLGALTSQLVNKNAKLDVIEIDHSLADKLITQFADQPNFNLHRSDALKTDLSTFTNEDNVLRIIGNLPYNISTPLLFHLLTFKKRINDMHFMLQKEVVDRMASPEGTKNYGRLSVMVQYQCHVEPLFLVPPSAFKPAPKVESAIVRLRPRKRETHALDPVFFAQMINSCFQQRRKTLRNGLKVLLKNIPLESLTDIDMSRRPETFSVDEFIALANQLSRLR